MTEDQTKGKRARYAKRQALLGPERMVVETLSDPVREKLACGHILVSPPGPGGRSPRSLEPGILRRRCTECKKEADSQAKGAL